MKALIVGAAMIDMLMKIDSLPKSGEDVLSSEAGIVVGGCAYNVAGTLKNMGCDHDLCVPVGKGPYADIIFSELKRCGYRILIQDDSKDNGFTLDLVEKNGERTFITSQGIEGAFRREWFDSLDMSLYDRVYIAGYQVCNEGGKAIADWICGLKEKQVFFAPGPVIGRIDPEVMEQIFSVHPILHLNEKEAADYSKTEDIEKAVRMIYEQTGNLVIITLGSLGALYYDGHDVHKVPAVKASVTDTIGAGDSHIGAVIGGMVRGYDTEAGIRYANRVAAAMVGVRGPVMSKETFDEKVGNLD
ncbi:hypothetical protein D7X88_13405 [bacterium C-53]|nr:hypothetical protein [Lachnospiraceae bacterium]NBI04011.1 hypothetical protein [Lachnospiraceae bacterium]RKJ08795.1 hypothetical protein D7X88_13405 [bacterium C-53]